GRDQRPKQLGRDSEVEQEEIAPFGSQKRSRHGSSGLARLEEFVEQREKRHLARLRLRQTICGEERGHPAITEIEYDAPNGQGEVLVAICDTRPPTIDERRYPYAARL